MWLLIAVGVVVALAVVWAVVRWALHAPPRSRTADRPFVQAPVAAAPRFTPRGAPKWQATAPFLDSLPADPVIRGGFQETQFEEEPPEVHTGFADTRVLDEDEAPPTVHSARRGTTRIGI